MTSQTGQKVRNLDALGGVEAFVRAAEQSSFVAAGRLLGISGSAVGKAVARLEARLGVRLLARTTRSVTLTDAGAVFYERANRILEDLCEAEQVVMERRETPRGRLRVSLPHNVGRLILLPSLATFVERYPEIELDIQLEDRVVDIVGDGIDVVIRTGELADSSLIARRLGPQHFVICGSPAYFARHPPPVTPHDLVRHRCIHFRFPTSGMTQFWCFCEEYAQTPIPAGLTFNNSDGIAGAVRSDLGVALLPVFVARPLIESGELRAVLTDYMVPRGSLWLAWPANRHRNPALRAFVDYVVAHLPEEALAPIT
ncbi:LysR family transcriptional regulator [Bradyrhizobium sp. U87765 SZCCT0131]|uniref:LysR family transcriptional regulator n=1 Tax=unclassified Bradyrhizobium TaxID=2631580 RepID=UPI001BAC3883|nr:MULTISPECIES: LysR family transcriptional regulator [unclassified Bradyrhizobium]MBR1217045.1 LysR family transcriptional regulator [Bradyrhizobium sp. U87765 SZCCT0131]MBR1259199.1 LysR family transcriptional regulator [Bradyrhizobium sp. U87765 SZCCT0134]MBR1305340.1 LysR family transcriptional regulator [Bradyrhizobium sp. U87765 SZCCT0110]MBR1321126.1 LysR family transcriptional regulator [Bradyrhizobium sp. U87765 SZCCT0109]MBR1350220.1 LysR family transcriptional regulator [Bradyrhizo